MIISGIRYMFTLIMTFFQMICEVVLHYQLKKLMMKRLAYYYKENKSDLNRLSIMNFTFYLIRFIRSILIFVADNKNAKKCHSIIVYFFMKKVGNR